MKFTICDLRTEYRHNPLGIDATAPRFSWKLKSTAKGVRQTSYRIMAQAGSILLWDSGTVETGGSQRISYKGTPLSSRQRVTWNVRITAEDADGNTSAAQSSHAWFEMGLLHASDWNAEWIEPENEVDEEARKPAPYLRREFTVKKGLRSARIYSTAHGLYEFWINAQCGTTDKFKPGLTSYYHRIQYQAYDITPLLREGVNCWAVMLGDGWWRGVTGGTVKNNFGRKLHYFGQLELLYADGSREIVPTDEHFMTSNGGLLATDMLMGDIFDARLEPEGWKYAGFDDSSWSRVHLATGHTDATLIASRSVPVVEKEHFQAKPFTDAAGRLVLDFGQNLAGYVKMQLRGCRAGQEIRLIHGEALDHDHCFSLSNCTPPPLPVSQFQEVLYTCSGKEVENYCPLFAVFGFRYVLIEGYEGSIEPEAFTAVAVYSGLEETGEFTCSNPLVNQLVSNARWSMKSNFLDVATDCPTRERNAWTGDNQVYVRTAASFMNVYPFYEKWLQDLSIEQYASGKIGITFPSTSSVHDPDALGAAQKLNPVFALAGPQGNGSIGEDSAGWGDAAVWLPYSIYLYYGDRQILENQYESARKWLEFMLSCAREHNPLHESEPQYHNRTDGELDADFIFDTRIHYGEWLEPIPPSREMLAKLAGKDPVEAFFESARQGRPLVATAYMARSAENVAHMADILGLKKDSGNYSALSRKIKMVYNKYLISDDGVIEPGHQAAYVRALSMGLCSPQKRPLVEAQLVREIEANGCRLNTGFLSTPYLLPVLCDMGREDLAYRILEQTEAPGWLHPVTLGATSIPENWNGFDTCSGSLNHYSYGAVCEFLFAYTAGIRPCFEEPGYKSFELKPVPGGSLTYAEASMESIYGTIKSSWHIQDGQFQYECMVPANTTAQLSLPNGDTHTLTGGSYQFTVPFQT